MLPDITYFPSRGINLAYSYYPCELSTAVQLCLGTLIYVHGFTTSGTVNLKYTDMTGKLIKAGYNVVGVDLVGHGKSGGQDFTVLEEPDYITDFKNLLKNLETMDRLKSPIYVYGVSLGGALVYNFAADSDIKKYLKGIILISPLFEISPIHYGSLLKWKWALLALYYICPNKSLGEALGPLREPLLSDEKARERYAELVKQRKTNFLTIRAARNLYKLTQLIEGKVKEIETPVLMAHARDDDEAVFETSEKIFKELNVKDKKFQAFEKNGHYIDMLNEEEITGLILQFFESTKNGSLEKKTDAI